MEVNSAKNYCFCWFIEMSSRALLKFFVFLIECLGDFGRLNAGIRIYLLEKYGERVIEVSKERNSLKQLSNFIIERGSHSVDRNKQ